jgi:3',5'-cyclic-AMP phosphodiesterase
MSVLINSKQNRRKFLSTTMAGLGAMTVLKSSYSSADEAKSTKWAFLSDIHVPRDPSNEYRGFRPFDNMKQAVAEVIASDVEGALITGDLARLEGFAGDYAALKNLSAPLVEKMPLGMALGNHDHRGNFRNAFKEYPGTNHKPGGKHVLVIEQPQARFILLDSMLYSNKVSGLIGKAQRNWLREYLRGADDRPTILFFHHDLGDSDGALLDADRLFSIIVPSRKVKAIVYGHSHAWNIQERFGIQMINLPAVAYNFSDSQPIGWMEVDMDTQGAQFTMHAIGGNMDMNGQVTKLAWRS